MAEGGVEPFGNPPSVLEARDRPFAEGTVWLVPRRAYEPSWRDSLGTPWEDWLFTERI
jgi:hypothetical protein